MARFSDAQLVQIVEKAARRINRRLNLTDTDDQIYVDASGSLSPDNQDLQDLVMLQAECMILNIDANTDFTSSADGTGLGFFVRDGEQSFDSRGEVANRANARSAYMKTPFNPCAELEKAIREEELNRSGRNGKLIW